MLVFIDESGRSGFEVTRAADAFFVVGMVIFETNSAAQYTGQCLKNWRAGRSAKDDGFPSGRAVATG
jgi:hypothetical protein